MYDLYQKKRPLVATDIAIFTLINNKLHTLLIERKHEPYKGKWALPGGFMDLGETCEQSAARELQEETGVENVPLELLGVFSRPDRDPRAQVISVAYIGLVRADEVQPKGQDDAADARFVPFEECHDLAADHDDMIAAAKKFLLQKKYEPTWFARMFPDSTSINEQKVIIDNILSF